MPKTAFYCIKLGKTSKLHGEDLLIRNYFGRKCGQRVLEGQINCCRFHLINLQYPSVQIPFVNSHLDQKAIFPLVYPSIIQHHFYPDRPDKSLRKLHGLKRRSMDILHRSIFSKLLPALFLLDKESPCEIILRCLQAPAARSYCTRYSVRYDDDNLLQK